MLVIGLIGVILTASHDVQLYHVINKNSFNVVLIVSI